MLADERAEIGIAQKQRSIHARQVGTASLPTTGNTRAARAARRSCESACRGGVGDERPDFVGSRQRAGNVEADPAEKFLVAAQIGRRNAQVRQPGGDQLVDFVMRLKRCQVRRGLASGTSTGIDCTSLPNEATKAVSPGAGGDDLAQAVHRRYAVIVRRELRQASHVLDRVVRKMGDHAKLRRSPLPFSSRLAGVMSRRVMVASAPGL